MPSAKIITFPRTFRRFPLSPPVRPVSYRGRRDQGYGFGLLFAATQAAAFFYLTGAMHAARHDILYAALLTAVWGVYFLHPSLLKVRVLGPLLVRAGRLLLLAGLAAFFVGIYWLIFTRG